TRVNRSRICIAICWVGARWLGRRGDPDVLAAAVGIGFGVAQASSPASSSGTRGGDAPRTRRRGRLRYAKEAAPSGGGLERVKTYWKLRIENLLLVINFGECR